MFGRATIRLGIGPHSSYLYFIFKFYVLRLWHTTLDRLLAVFTARRSYASEVLGVVILSVCLFVHHTRAL